MKHISFCLALFAFAFSVVGCSGGTELELTAGDAMSYSTTNLAAKAGEEITLRFRHTGQMPKNAMGHNVVILQPGTDLAAFATAAVEAGPDANYVPAGAEQVVAHTRLLGGGESAEIKFTITEPGTYPFVCTFPGHYAMMQGELVVQ